ncbi:hypothetical protein [Microbulbifer sp. GL-2]|nr:hypothetical protein [Microbulbifer sp. GL-2]
MNQRLAGKVYWKAERHGMNAPELAIGDGARAGRAPSINAPTANQSAA